MHKKTLRKKLLEQRNKKSQQYLNQKSKKIYEKILNFPIFTKSSHILFYVSYNGEVQTHHLIKKAFSMNKNVYVPISEPKTHTLKISKLNHFDDLTKGTYGILEPKKEKQHIKSIKQIETILIPGVGFDSNGNRIGHGGGYYDWLLSHSTATSIGLAFEFQIKKQIPTETHDKKIDYIITEKRMINCNR